MNAKTFGNIGESVAANYLRSVGYEIIDRNYHSRYGEVDIIAVNAIFVVFVEVKTRKTSAFATAVESVNYRKQAKIRTTAELWLQEHDTNLQPRFDVVEIYINQGREPEVNHIENAF